MADGEAKPGYGPVDDDDCAMCDGSGEIDVPKLDEYGNLPCPDCISRELNGRIAELTALLREIDNKVIFETAVIDGTGRHLQERIEAALGIGN